MSPWRSARRSSSTVFMYSAIAMMYPALIDCCSDDAHARRLADAVVHGGEEVAHATLRQTHEAQEDHRRVLAREVAVQVAAAAGDEASR